MPDRIKNHFLNCFTFISAGTESGPQHWWLLPGDYHCYDASPEDPGSSDGGAEHDQNHAT
ncbi:hypothetical protein IWX65_003068 [Arthrobacter sp. CAN_A214]|uniref:hypothetical protein n=1 Tax=Arthrobacter sp. CAN_A214 TaxID=2787720 RepID=UPI0018C919D6